MANARALRAGADRIDVLAALVPAVRAAAAARGALTAPSFTSSSAATGRAAGAASRRSAASCSGIDARGGLLVRTDAGDVAARSGSLILEEDS